MWPPRVPRALRAHFLSWSIINGADRQRIGHLLSFSGKFALAVTGFQGILRLRLDTEVDIPWIRNGWKDPLPETAKPTQ
jgi:hypothetical protein